LSDVLIVGSGGREHALAWKLRQSPRVGQIFVAPGNGGTSGPAINVDLAETDVDAICRFVEERNIGLTVVGPELPLSLGLSDRLAAEDHAVCGPSRTAARLETSKVFAKDFMARHGLPTAAYRIATDFDEGRQAVCELGLPVAVKVDGLAAGKGVTVCRTTAEAEQALRQIFVECRFGAAGRAAVVEQGLSGEEVSVLAFCDGERAVPMLPAQDHKAVNDGDRGPNTGGMGSYAPAPVLDAAGLEQTVRTIFDPAVAGMRAEGMPYRGVLYAGLMLTADGPQVLEFNVRFGDPETQSILPLLDDDLFDILNACAAGSLDSAALRWWPAAAVCVVCASAGYPDTYPKGLPIHGLAKAEAPPGVTVFHGGTRQRGDGHVTSGGRVLGVTCRAVDLRAAVDGAYSAVRCIQFDGMHYRTDIAAKGLKRLANQA
jgi:phosphoribosylamine---glycine ligase